MPHAREKKVPLPPRNKQKNNNIASIAVVDICILLYFCFSYIYTAPPPPSLPHNFLLPFNNATLAPNQKAET